jgi:amino acid adenylation domain-containing protein
MSPQTLNKLLNDSAARYPARPAFRFGDDEMTYADLKMAARSFATALTRRGVGKGDRVGILLNKGLEMPVAVYSAMAAGGVFVPIDPLAPRGRIANIIKQCGIRLTITSQRLASRLPMEVAEVLITDDHPAWTTTPSNTSDTLPALSGEDIAYIIFTSGSTGQPKGIVHSHSSAVAFVRMMAEHFGLRADDRVSGVSPLHFDMSTFDFFAANAVGACTVLFSEAHQKVPASMTALCEAARLTVWYSTPFSLIQALEFGGLEQRNWKSLRRIIYAGEAFPVRHLNRLIALLPETHFSNAYGPAETNVSHIFDLPPGKWPHQQVPIGYSCTDVATRVVDSQGRDALEGELWLSAPTMLREYWQSPEATAATIVKHAGKRFYRTGDNVRVSPAGLFQFIGRVDRQVKLRGFRIELDEVERALNCLQGVAQASAVLVSNPGTGGAIYADVTLELGVSLSGNDIRKRLLDELPRYAVPERIAVRHELPLTSSGKLDRRAIQVQWQSEGGLNA